LPEREAETAMSIVSYRDLDAWNVAVDLTVSVYELVKKLPAWERFGLCSQMQRAAVSVPSNIAEGQAYGPGLRYHNHVRIAGGSVAELSTCVEVCVRVGHIDAAVAASIQKEITRTAKLVRGLRNSLIRRSAKEAGKIGCVVLACWWFFR
jgi:four helix bundle protein